MTELKLGNIKSIAVVGGGPCGSAAIKSLLKENAFSRIVGFERRFETGGLWNYSDETSNTQKLPVPSLDPHDPSLLTPFKKPEDGSYIWPSAIYELLDTNVPYQIMEYSGTKFPESSKIFPTKQEVLDYFKEYSKEVEQYIKFGTIVVDVSFFPENENEKWRVTYRKVCDETNGGLEESDLVPDEVEMFDAVLLASGHYDLPYVPDRPGLKEWSAKYPNSVSHAKSFRHARQFKDAKGEILLVGNSASGLDLAYQLATILKRPVYKSARSKSSLPGGSSDFIKTVPDIESLDPETKQVKFVDGTTLDNVEKIIFATGYLRHYPYLKSLNSSDKPLVTNGERIRNLYKQLLSYNYPGLAFICVPRYILPTRVSETQTSWLAKVFTHKIKLPSVEQMEEEENKLLEERGDCPKFHNMMYPEDVLYSRSLNEEIKTVPGWEKTMVPCEWTYEDIQLRASANPLKEAYLKYKELNDGKCVTSVDELENSLGFQYAEVDKSLFGLD
ncbi:hypothetical protein CANARDRAFT_7213 [[Candida] arabinofermentans NRRL YB-2248]|uniref:FAD/NAD(P)-binding domain-containing protein n=1 Tax=[Candida] arabinofermentans NRRL YB-2248 TaxID=983967 RepID=A0A1E4T259_9ASCO|nr:hypothetical protein CANARDRAFT_7213 [[Candida] arabinofermentans NRRL YB-2248]